MRSYMIRGLLVATAVLAGVPGARAADEAVAKVNGKAITRGQLVEELLVRHGEFLYAYDLNATPINREQQP